MTIVEEIKKLSKKYQVNVIYQKFDDLGGYIIPNNPTDIFISTECKKNRSELLRIFFHELGHIMCIRNGKWDAYHSSFENYYNKNKYYKNYIRTALKAERWVDNWAHNELKKYDKRIKYDFPYSGENGKNWFHKTHLNNIRYEMG